MIAIQKPVLQVKTRNLELRLLSRGTPTVAIPIYSDGTPLGLLLAITHSSLIGYEYPFTVTPSARPLEVSVEYS